MDKKLVQAINEQIKNELYSGYLYLSMAAYFENKNLPGFAHWMKVQAKEEYEHAMKFFDFLNDRGERVILEAIDKPEADFKSPLEVFQKTLAHEQTVTAMINELYDLAIKVKDNPAVVLLQWYITEQVEEEKNPTAILEQLKLIKADSPAILIIDKNLGKRE